MRHLGGCVLVLLVAASAAGAQPPTPPAQLKLTFGDEAVTASGATPSAKVAWFSVAREIGDFTARIVKREAMVDATAAGEASFALKASVPWQSIWVAVDVETGGFAVGTPAGFELRELAFDDQPLRPGSGGADVLTAPHDFLEVFLVRPKKGGARSGGAFGGTVGDGGISDEDRTSNRSVTLALTRLRPVGESAELVPPVASPDDVVAVIDPNAMAVAVMRLSPGARP